MPVDEDAGYGSYDPEQYRPKVETGDDDDNKRQAPDGLYDAEGNPLPSFDQRYAEDFTGLLYLGAMTRSFEWLGHHFVIRTLSMDELLAVGQIMKPWMGTVAEPKAYTVAMVALSVVTVDGKDELPIPVSDGKGEYAWAYQRFNYVKAHWHSPTIDRVYSEYRALETKVDAVIEAMEKASGPVGSTGGSNATSAGPSDEDS